MPERDSGGGECRRRPGGEHGVEGHDVLVLDRLAYVTELRCRVADDGADRHCALGDDGGEYCAANRLDRSAEELREVDDVAADVGQCPRPGTSLVAPAHRPRGVDAVVAQVPHTELHRCTDPALGHEAAHRRDRRRPSKREADRRLEPGALGGGHHRLGVGDRRGQRLLAEHVLARRQKSLDHLAVQGVGEDDAHHVDVRCAGDGLPAGLAALVAVTTRRVGRKVSHWRRRPRPTGRPGAAGRRASGRFGSRRRGPALPCLRPPRRPRWISDSWPLPIL